jgi:NADH-quinone oxidoreductase subunit G
VPADQLSNATSAVTNVTATPTVPCVAAIYALDGTVRRAASLQLTADARQSEQGVAA